MSFTKALTSITLGLVVAGSFQLASTQGMLKPVFAQSNVDVLLADSKSTLEGAKNRLSDFDSKLEFPMSDAEKKESQDKLNKFRSNCSVTKSTEISAKMINSIATSALELGKLACKEAESGDRKKALESFTAARIKLFHSKSLLTEFENREASKIATSKKKLSASARKDDHLMLANKQQTNSVVQNNSVVEPGQTKVNIGPGGITVKDTTGYGNARHTNVAIGPGGINVQENRRPNQVSNTNVNINPSGIQVNKSSVYGGTQNKKVTIGPGGINVHEHGVPGNRNTQVNINPNGINVREQGAPGQYRNTNVTINPGPQFVNPNQGRAPINISPGGVRVGAPGGPSAVNIGANGIQVGSTGQPGRSAVSIGANGINIGGLGDLGAALGQVGAALGNTGVQLGQAGVNMTRGSVNSTTITTSQGPHGNNIIINGHSQNKTLRLNGQNVLVSGHSHNIRIIGFASSVNISGHSNDVTIDTVANLNVSGHNNDVFWKNGPNGKWPNLVTSGRNNDVKRIR